MERDRILTTEEASEAQWQHVRDGRLPIWVVTADTSDYPGKFCARITAAGRAVHVTNQVMLADDLQTLRDMLPPGLVKMDRDPTDPDGVVESWI